MIVAGIANAFDAFAAYLGYLASTACACIKLNNVGIPSVFFHYQCLPAIAQIIL